ncbi:hypothetical protein L9F63_024793, partial [Diploptera punctata]
VGETLDSWQRFLAVHKPVMYWVDTKRPFMKQPLKLSDLIQARQKQHKYSSALIPHPKDRASSFSELTDL